MEKIILLHGALGAESDFSELSEKLSTLGFKLYPFSFSGHGKKPFLSEFGIVQFTAELSQFMNDHNLDGAMIFGYSMGGYVALLAEAFYPGLCGGIITLGTKFNWTDEVIERESGVCNKDFLAAKAPAFLSLLKEKHLDAEELLIRTSGMIKSFAKNKLVTTEVLQKLKIPVLVGRGDRDKMVNSEETIDAYSHLTNGGTFILPFTRHELNTASTSLLTQIIVDFSKKIQKTSGS